MSRRSKRRGGAGPNRRGAFRVPARLPSWNFSPAESAAILPAMAIWISQQGITLGVGVASWASYLGGLSSTVAQAVGGQQPAYSAGGGVGGRPLITFDGTDDALEGAIAKGSAWSDYEQGWVGARTAFSAIGDPILGFLNAGTYRWSFSDRTLATVRFNVNGGANQDYAITDGVNVHLSGRSVLNVQTLEAYGVVVASAASVTTSRADPGTVRFGSITAGPSITAQAFYMGASLTTVQRTYLRALLTFYTGIAC